MSKAAESLGMRTLSVRLPFVKLLKEAPLPAIAHWQQNTFIVVYKLNPGKVYVADPDYGKLTYTEDEFLAGWAINDDQEGVALLLETTVDFYRN